MNFPHHWTCEFCAKDFGYESTLVLDHDTRREIQAHVLSHSVAS